MASDHVLGSVGYISSDVFVLVLLADTLLLCCYVVAALVATGWCY